MFVKLTLHARDFVVAISRKQFSGTCPWSAGIPCCSRVGSCFSDLQVSLLLLSGPMVPCQRAREAQGFTSSCISWGLYHIKVERPYSMAHFRLSHPMPPPSVCRFNLLGRILVLFPLNPDDQGACATVIFTGLWFEFHSGPSSSVDLPCTC